MSTRLLFALVGVLAALAGTALWLGTLPSQQTPSKAGGLAPAVLLTTVFQDPGGRDRTLGEFQGKILVLNFWATWCAPCREEMPTFERAQRHWAGRVQFVGLSEDEAPKVERFAGDLGISYPLWIGGDAVGEMSRRLGNRLGVLPFTVIDRKSTRLNSSHWL